MITKKGNIDVLEEKDLKHTLGDDDSDGNEKVTVSYNDDNFTSIRFSIFMKKKGTSATLRVWNLVDVSAGKNFTLDVLNYLNYSYRFIPFHLDETNNTITCAGDLVYRDMLIMLDIPDDDEVITAPLSLK